ncbi:hypothetical protein [Duganella sp. S19_KUP01_CR8]|uniref:hypothetical protein n=1 Tax=Duganella sp. S19_KUP01_CR8 TaxID=3025502 RepID=UPI002FCD92F1
MQSELAIAGATSPLLEPDSLPSAARSIAVSDLKSDRMAEIMRVISSSELRSKMRKRACSGDLRTADFDSQIQGLSEFGEAYLPLGETVTFAAQVLAKIRQVYRAKNFGSEEFRLYFHAMSKVMSGGRLPPVPSCVATISETGFWLTGPSGMGRTATLKRLAEILGKPFMVEGNHPAPRRMWITPILFLTYPTCGTRAGLLRDMRMRVLADIGTHATDSNALSDLERDDEEAAIALCTLLNVGLVVVDGAGWNCVNGHTQRIFSFLLKLRQFSGVPVLVSGTSAFMHSASYMGNIATNLFNGPGLHIGPPKPPVKKDDDGSVPKSQGVWTQMVSWLWKEGFLPKNCEMPAGLPEWLYEASMGRFRWLVQGFKALHIALLSNAELQKPGVLTESLVKHIFNATLQLHNGARIAISLMEGGPTGKGKLQFLKNLDHCSTADFSYAQVEDWLDEAILKRV